MVKQPDHIVGLVLAGGHGRRLRPLTYSGPKQLVPVANRAILDYALLSLCDAGIQEIGVVVSPEHRADIEAHLVALTDVPARFTLIEQPYAGGLAHAVQIARDFLAKRSFALYLGDNLIGASLKSYVEEFRSRPEVAAWLWLKEVDDPRAFGVAVLDAAGEICGLVEKPQDPPSNLALCGVYLLRDEVFDVIATQAPSARGELEITDTIAGLLARGRAVHFARLQEYWLDTGKKDDLLSANQVVLEHRLEPALLGQVCPQTRLQGTIRIEAGASVTRCTLIGPSIIGADAVLEDSTIGPQTSIGRGACVTRSRVSHSVVLAEAVVCDIDHITRSLIGKRSRVCGVSPDQGTQLNVGDDSELLLTRPPG